MHMFQVYSNTVAPKLEEILLSMGYLFFFNVGNLSVAEGILVWRAI